MLWFWDRDEVEATVRASGFDPAAFTAIAEPLMLPVPNRSGAWELAGQGGIDHLDLDRGAIRNSRWEATRPGQRPTVPSLMSRPWANNLLRERWPAGGIGTAPGTLAVVGSWTLTALAAAYLAYWAGTFVGVQAQVEASSGQPDRQAAELAELKQVKSSERGNAAWLDHYHRLSASVQVDALLNALEKPLEAHRLVIKELELRNDDLRLTLASVGSDIDLPGVLQALEDIPGIDTVQLRQNADTLQATYTMRSPGFRRPAAVPHGEGR